MYFFAGQCPPLGAHWSLCRNGGGARMDCAALCQRVIAPECGAVWWQRWALWHQPVLHWHPPGLGRPGARTLCAGLCHQPRGPGQDARGPQRRAQRRTWHLDRRKRSTHQQPRRGGGAAVGGAHGGLAHLWRVQRLWHGRGVRVARRRIERWWHLAPPSRWPPCCAQQHVVHRDRPRAPGQPGFVWRRIPGLHRLVAPQPTGSGQRRRGAARRTRARSAPTAPARRHHHR